MSASMLSGGIANTASEIEIPARGAKLEGNLTMPEGAHGIVLFAMAAAAAGIARVTASSPKR